MPTPPPAFHVMVKPRGAICNLDCAYCFYLTKEQLFPEGSFRMSDAVLDSFTRQYIQAQRVPEVTFAWQGGEPTLMGLEFFERAVTLQQQYCPPGMNISNSFQTNATLIDDDWARFFHENNFLLGVSLDGPADLHDLYRRDKGGQPTHARVLAGIEHLKRRGVQFNILACVNDQTAQHPLEVYHYFRDEIGAQFIQFIPIVEVEDAAAGKASSRSVSGRAYGRFLNAIFDEWVRQDVGRVYVQTLRHRPGHLERAARRVVRVCLHLRRRPGPGTHRRPVRLRPLRQPAASPGQHPGNPAGRPGRLASPGSVWTRQKDLPAQAVLGMPRAVCLPRRLPQGPHPDHPARRAGAQLPV